MVKINASPAQDGKTVALVGNAFTYTVSDLLDNVKRVYDDTFLY